MKINENLIYIFLLGILAGIICVRCVNHLGKSPKRYVYRQFRIRERKLYIFKKEGTKKWAFECLDQGAIGEQTL